MFTIQKYVCTQKMSSLDKPRIGMFSHHGVMPANQIISNIPYRVVDPSFLSIPLVRGDNCVGNWVIMCKTANYWDDNSISYFLQIYKPIILKHRVKRVKIQVSSLDCVYIYLCDNDYIHVGSKVNTMTNLEINVNRKPLNIKISLILQ